MSTQVYKGVFGPNTAAGSPGAVGDIAIVGRAGAWQLPDGSASLWHVAGNNLVGGTGGTSYYADPLLRPASEGTGDQGIVVLLPAGVGYPVRVACVLRRSGTTYYYVELVTDGAGNATAFYFAGNGAGINNALFPTLGVLNPSHQYAAIFNATGSGPVALSLTVIDLSNAGAVVGTPWTYSESEFVYPVGVPGITVASDSVATPILMVEVYQGGAAPTTVPAAYEAFYADLVSIPVSATTTVAFTGLGSTNWTSGTTFTPTGLAGLVASGSPTIISATSATQAYTTGSTAGTGSISDGVFAASLPVITAATPTGYTLSAGPNPVVEGNALTVTATISPSGAAASASGTIALVDGSDNPLGSIAFLAGQPYGSVVLYPSTAGSLEIDGSHTGLGFTGADPSTITVTVTSTPAPSVSFFPATLPSGTGAVSVSVTAEYCGLTVAGLVFPGSALPLYFGTIPTIGALTNFNGSNPAAQTFTASITPGIPSGPGLGRMALQVGSVIGILPVTPAIINNGVCFGDSLTYGTNASNPDGDGLFNDATATSYPARLWVRLGPSWSMWKYGYPGNTVAQVHAQILAVVGSGPAPFVATEGIKNYFCVMAGTNNLIFPSGSPTISELVASTALDLTSFVAYLRSLQNAGDKITLLAIPPSSQTNGQSIPDDGIFCLRKDAYNAYLRANYAAIGADDFGDLERASVYFEDGAQYNAAWYNQTDMTHCTDLVYDGLAQVVAGVIVAPVVSGGSTSNDPGVANVRATVVYEINGSSLTGTYDPITGHYSDPGVATVEASHTYLFAGATLTGTYDPIADQYSDPGIATVELGHTYLFAGATLTGTFAGGGGGGGLTQEQAQAACASALAAYSVATSGEVAGAATIAGITTLLGSGITTLAPSPESIQGTVVSATTTSATVSYLGGAAFNPTANAYAGAVPRYLSFTSGPNEGLPVVVNSSSVSAGNLTLGFAATVGIVAASPGNTLQVD
jgi:hypothetical protein